MAQPIATTCCIAGGGPAGMMLGLLLARAGVDVVVLEKHGDFLRDFRGDTIHPSTLEVIGELGLLDRFLELPHEQVRQLTAEIGPDRLELVRFDRLPTRCKFLALMPQWDFLDFLAREARAFAGFRLLMQAEVTGLVEQDGRIVGAAVATADGPREVRARLTVGADGRDSVVRTAAGLPIERRGSPMDVLWFRLSRHRSDSAETFGRAQAGRLMILLNRGDYWQCAFVIAKDSYAALREEGVAGFRQQVATMSPFLADRVGEIGSWDDVKLLTVKVDRLRRWHRPGLLCIGDAAHAMSPVGGVGVNLAVQDAVAAANQLAGPLRSGDDLDRHLEAVQKRRLLPTRLTQGVQLAVQKRLIGPLLESQGQLRAPLLLRLLPKVPLLRRVPGYLVGVGVRPEHVRSGSAG